MKTLFRNLVLLAPTLSVSLLFCAATQLAQAYSWQTNTPMGTARDGHTATLLPDGRVLVAGGSNGYFTPALVSAEIFDPATGTWTNTGSMNTGRAGHTATLLLNGKVLVTAGWSTDAPHQAPHVIDSAELYDPATGQWNVTGSLHISRTLHTATLLPNGQVLVAGGLGPNPFDALNTAELYDPQTETWTMTGPLGTARLWHTATLLPTGQVLVTGGTNRGSFGPISSAAGFKSVELFDPATGAWQSGPSLNKGRVGHTANLLPNGNILVWGGNSAGGEMYRQSNGTWKATAPAIWVEGNTSTVLPDGSVLLIYPAVWPGPLTGILYYPSNETYLYTTGFPAANGITLFTATLLTTGRVLLAGGIDGNLQATNLVSVLDSSNVAASVAGRLHAARATDGSVQLAFAGSPNGTNRVLASTDLTLPQTNWSSVGVASEISPGLYLFTDSQTTNVPQRYYRVR